MLYLCNSHGRPLPCRGRVSVTHTHHFFRIYTSTTEIYTLSLHDALPIFLQLGEDVAQRRLAHPVGHVPSEIEGPQPTDRKSTRLNSSHTVISYAVFCLKKKIQRAKRLVVAAHTAGNLDGDGLQRLGGTFE